jgi:hypothetical protein
LGTKRRYFGGIARLKSGAPMPMTKQINENHWMNHSKGEERGEEIKTT